MRDLQGEAGECRMVDMEDATGICDVAGGMNIKTPNHQRDDIEALPLMNMSHPSFECFISSSSFV